MGWPDYDVSDLSEFTGRDIETYPEFSTTALRQALLLFRLATCLDDFPTDEIDAELSMYAILDMADRLVIAQPYTLVNANPFSSETIGSYSYSKLTTAIATGLPTGSTFFDMAVSRLSVCSTGITISEDISVFEYDVPLAVVNGQRVVLSPVHQHQTGGWLHDPSQAPLLP